MKPLDYARSFLIGKCPANEVRFWVESRTRVIDERSGRTEDYIQCASCKSEDTFAPHDLFFEDNYDFLPVFGPEFGLIFRRKAGLNANYRSCPKTEDMWGGQVYHLVDSTSAEELTTAQDILRATREWSPLVAQTDIHSRETGLHAIIEYPVKTMNTRRDVSLYQVDTGPVALPDLGKPVERFVDAISLAYVAFNAPHFADFVVEEPTSVGAGGVQVYHYSRRISLASANRLYAVT